MQSFYFLRHGLTDANIQKLLCGGDWDIALNQEGESQAAAAAKAYARALAEVRTIYASPMIRAQQTAAYFVQELKVPLILLEDLREQRLGSWDRKPWHEVPQFFSGEQEPPEGESRAELDHRITRALQRIAVPHEPALLVAHGAVWFAVHRVLGLEPFHPGSSIPFYFQKKDAGTPDTHDFYPAVQLVPSL